ncbi:GIY-YIG nuclease family protein [Candidatus Roizmanbacteria bacterium]|nr:GIY-YIG nuclease family protein [Candidatus Roizmanbacteria bacterium]
MFFYTYVLLSLKDNQFYIGYSSNLKERIKEHSSGKNTSTNPRRPLKLIYYEAHLSKVDAMRREKYFKTEKGKSSLRQMIRESLNNT